MVFVVLHGQLFFCAEHQPSVRRTEERRETPVQPREAKWEDRPAPATSCCESVACAAGACGPSLDVSSALQNTLGFGGTLTLKLRFSRPRRFLFLCFCPMFSINATASTTAHGVSALRGGRDLAPLWRGGSRCPAHPLAGGDAVRGAIEMVRAAF